MDVRGQLHAPLRFTPRKNSSTHRIGSRADPIAGLDVAEDRNYLLTGIEPLPLGQAARSLVTVWTESSRLPLQSILLSLTDCECWG